LPYRKIASFRSPAELREHFVALGIDLPCDDGILSTNEGSPLAEPLSVAGRTLGNRFCVHPMEGWDGELDGNPSELTRRRWRRFGASGAKLIWGGEAVAISMDARANPRQLVLRRETERGIAALREMLIETHRERFGNADDLLVGLQLTHSGRYCRPFPDGRSVPRIACRHPVLDRRVGVASDASILSDGELQDIRDAFVGAARTASRLGFDFVDLKHCHGYLLHELIGARGRPGDYGGSFENRTRLFREIVAGIRNEAPDLLLGVRLSLFDLVPYRPDPAASDRSQAVGVPETSPGESAIAFNLIEGSSVDPDLADSRRFLALMDELEIPLLNATAGSPYTNPHAQRPAWYPPSDGYLAPEDPLVGVARQLFAARAARRCFRGDVVVGTAFTYLQGFLPHVAQSVVREGWMDMAGLGRTMLSYPELPADVLRDGRLDPRRLCRTFSDCTTGPRRGFVSGCYPLDDFYRARPESKKLW